jgi:hypothetical protein
MRKIWGTFELTWNEFQPPCIASSRDHEEDAMRKLTLIVAAAAAVAVPLIGTSAVSAGDRDDYYRDRRTFYRDRDDCREVTVRERRGDEVIVRRERRCD